jgi:hypothetical protein
VAGFHELQRSRLPPAVAAPVVRPTIDRDLLDAASGVEAEARFWRAEFEWLLRHPAIAAVAGGGENDAQLTLRTIAGQHAARFPVISGDADWLSNRSMTVVARRVAPLLAGGGQVALDLTALNRGDTPPAVGREQMRLVVKGLDASFPAALRRLELEPGRLAFSVSADHPGLGELLRLRESSALGRPRIVIRLPDRLMMALRGMPSGEPLHGTSDSLGLWHGVTGLAHREPGVHLVLQHTTRPACALAGCERADAILPVSLFEARADTAWLALSIRLDCLVIRSPDDGLRELRRLLRAGLRLADNLVDQLDWASPERAQDALVNRRIAVHVTGIGSLVDRWRLDPAVFASVDLVVRWLGIVRRLVLRESNALARERGPFPGLQLRDLASTLTRSFGEEQARRLLRQAGLRHRHLLVLSPYGVFPSGAPRWPLPAYLHLLPAIRWADTIAMHGDGIGRALPIAAFRRLIRLTSAIAHNRP